MGLYGLIEKVSDLANELDPNNTGFVTWDEFN